MKGSSYILFWIEYPVPILSIPWKFLPLEQWYQLARSRIDEQKKEWTQKLPGTSLGKTMEVYGTQFVNHEACTSLELSCESSGHIEASPTANISWSDTASSLPFIYD